MRAALQIIRPSPDFLLAALFLLISGGMIMALGRPESRVSPRAVILNDVDGREVAVELPVNSLISLNSGLSEIVAALDAGGRIIGRDSFSSFPSFLNKIPVVGRNSSGVSMESILALQPDLILADAMFDESHIEILRKQGIPVIIESTSNPLRIALMVRNMGRILQVEERAQHIIAVIDEILGEVDMAVEGLGLSDEEKMAVFYENRKPNKSASALSGHDFFIRHAGGISIAADEPVRFPELSPEYIAVRNPDVIIRRVSGDITRKAMESMRQDIMARPSLRSVNAVKNHRVHIVKSDLFISLRYPVGIAYLAKLFYPDSFGLDPQKMYRRYVTMLYGEEEWGRMDEIYVHP
ncbi:MAG: hypothetical protein B6D68_00415 [spirochete symbiont of Stewartia floridana]|nr:MAG: hypothetical protein B6D68_00415 [spirochete symbiont of Stewartia floridana]